MQTMKCACPASVLASSHKLYGAGPRAQSGGKASRHVLVGRGGQIGHPGHWRRLTTLSSWLEPPRMPLSSWSTVMDPVASSREGRRETSSPLPRRHLAARQPTPVGESIVTRASFEAERVADPLGPLL